mmetsp:Transcript_3991/g.16274  ORF Transcript_3991/g.16274 Transcript_3991/m.16274 type:complete len:288 (-) Transcript_3991:1321-2184(-)
MAQRIAWPCCAGGMKGCLARLYLAWFASAAALICAALSAGDGARGDAPSLPSSPSSLLWSASISEPSLGCDGTRGKPLIRCCCCAANAAARCAPRPPSAPLGLRVAAAALARGERAPSAVSSLSSPSSSSSSSPSSSRSASSSSLSSPSQMTGLARGGLALVPLPKEEPLRWPGLAPPPPPPPPTEPAAGRIAAAPRSSAAMSCSSRSTCSGLASALTEATRTNVSLSDAILDSSSAMLVTPSAMSLLYSPGNAVPMLGPAAAAAAAAAAADSTGMPSTLIPWASAI